MAQVPSRAGSLALDVAAVLDSVDGDSLEDVFDRQSSLEEFATAASTAECLISRKRIVSWDLLPGVLKLVVLNHCLHVIYSPGVNFPAELPHS